MVLLVFLIDTSASMNQRTCLGTTYLDLAKGAVESFLKIRARDTNVSRGDRYMLVTYDGESKSVKAGWRENLVTFMKELKNLEGNELSNMGRALKDTFDLLNMHRLQSGIDNYGMGRNPYYLEPALILLLSDGCSMMDIGMIIPEINLPTNNLLPGGELTKELYRWDQRLFTLNLKIPGFASSVSENVPALQPEDMPLENMCELTGGKIYNVVSQKTLMQAMESIAQKILIPGVTISFEKYGADPEPIPKEGANAELEKNEKENTAPGAEPSILSNHDGMLPIMNGFIPPHFMDAKLVNGPFQNNIALPNDVGKVPNGLINATGLLPSPLLMPLVPPIPLPGRGMMPGSPMRGMLPPGFPPGLLRPPIPFSPPNRLVSPPSNDKPSILPLVNGNAEDSEMISVVEPKSEGESTKGSKIPEIPIRGEENSLDFNGNLDTLTMSNASINWQSQRRAIYVRTNVKGTVGHWPIPESFWPDSSMTQLPARSCHPVVNFTCTSTEAMAIDNMPFDKYEVEPSPLTQYILERKQPNVAWQTFVSGSSADSELGYPFGYLKASTNLQCVNFFVLPYNYTLIMPLLDELFKVHKCKPTPKWRQSFEDYLKTIPSYYSTPLRNALRRMGAPSNLMPDHMDGSMSYSVVSYLKKVKHQAKLEAERLTNLHSHPHCPDPVQITVPISPSFSDGKQNDFKQLLIQKSTAVLSKKLHSKESDSLKKSDPDLFEKFSDTGIPLLVDKFQVRSYKNPFDIHRGDMLQQCNRMRTNFFHIDTVCNRLHEEDSKHRISISQMGNYQAHVMQFKPLREVDPSQARVHTFGNPFKLKQDQIIAVDEADVNDSMAFGNNSKKRPGEQTPLLQRNKRKRSDTPPPSRRPLGPPNTPPPKIEAPPIDASAVQSEKTDDANNFMKASENFTDLPPEYSDTVKNIDSQCGGHMKLNDLKDTPGKSDSNINQQLRKLQQLHKNTKELGDRSTEIIFNEKFDEINDDLNSSPIMSILRTSLEEIDDKENEELAMINNNDSSNNLPSLCNDDALSNHSISTTVSSTSKSSPISNSMLKELRPAVKLKARLELQTLGNSKIRLAVWKAIRSRSDFREIFHLIEQLTASAVAKNLFITDIIAEACRFQLRHLAEKLRNLVEPVEMVLDR